MSKLELPILRGDRLRRPRPLPRSRSTRTEWLNLEYVDWKSSGDTRFAPLASAYGAGRVQRLLALQTRRSPTRTASGSTRRPRSRPRSTARAQEVGAQRRPVPRHRAAAQLLRRRALQPATSTTTTGSTPRARAGSCDASCSSPTTPTACMVLREDVDDPVDRDPDLAAGRRAAHRRLRSACGTPCGTRATSRGTASSPPSSPAPSLEKWICDNYARDPRRAARRSTRAAASAARPPRRSAAPRAPPTTATTPRTVMSEA